MGTDLKYVGHRSCVIRSSVGKRKEKGSRVYGGAADMKGACGRPIEAAHLYGYKDRVVA